MRKLLACLGLSVLVSSAGAAGPSENLAPLVPADLCGPPNIQVYFNYQRQPAIEKAVSDAFVAINKKHGNKFSYGFNPRCRGSWSYTVQAKLIGARGFYFTERLVVYLHEATADTVSSRVNTFIIPEIWQSVTLGDDADYRYFGETLLLNAPDTFETFFADWAATHK